MEITASVAIVSTSAKLRRGARERWDVTELSTLESKHDVAGLRRMIGLSLVVLSAERLPPESSDIRPNEIALDKREMLAAEVLKLFGLETQDFHVLADDPAG